MRESSEDLVLLYDGRCGFCNGMVRIILIHDQRGPLRFAAWESEYGERVKSRHRILETVDSVVLVSKDTQGGEERLHIRSDAVLRVAVYLGGVWRLLLVFYLIPKPARDMFYDIFARFRYRIFGRYQDCPLPPAEARARFLDHG